MLNIYFAYVDTTYTFHIINIVNNNNNKKIVIPIGRCNLFKIMLHLFIIYRNLITVESNY